jgi:hypothetical protein
METAETPTSSPPTEQASPPPEAEDVIQSLPVQETQALFDSIAKERIDLRESADETARLKGFFTALLWVGYSVALVVGVVLVWSAVNGLLKVIPR